MNCTFAEKMKTIIIAISVAISVAILALSASATQWPQISLADLIADADLVVIGKISRDDGKYTPPDDERPASLRHMWHSLLETTLCLRGGVYGGLIGVVWDEINLDGIPAYQLGEERIWILKKTDGENAYTTMGRPDTVLLTNQLTVVEMEIKKAANKRLEATGDPLRGSPAPQP